MSVGGVTPCESVRIRVNKRRENTRSDDDNTRDRCYRRRDVIVHLDCIFARNSLLLLPLSRVGLPPFIIAVRVRRTRKFTYDPRSSPKRHSASIYRNVLRLSARRRFSTREKKFGAGGSPGDEILFRAFLRYTRSAATFSTTERRHLCRRVHAFSLTRHALSTHRPVTERGGDDDVRRLAIPRNTSSTRLSLFSPGLTSLFPFFADASTGREQKGTRRPHRISRQSRVASMSDKIHDGEKKGEQDSGESAA